MQDAIKSILRILEEGSPELQIAAVQILGELRASEAAVVKALSDRLSHAEPYISRHIYTALAAIHTRPAIETLVARIGEPNQDGDLVAHLLRAAGEDVAPHLCAAFDAADAKAQKRILGILAGQKLPEAAAVLEKALYDPALSGRAADALTDGVLETLPAAKLRYFKDRLKKAVEKDGELPVEVKANLLRVYGVADPKRARAWLVKFSGADQPPVMRQAALSGLVGVSLTPTQAVTMLEFLNEGDFERIVKPTMDLLVDHPKWPDAAVSRLRKLLSSRRDHLRLFALRAFRNVPKAEVVKTLIGHLLGDDLAMRDAAKEALAQNAGAIDALLRALAHETDPTRARLVAAPLAALGGDLSGAQRKNLLERGCKALVANDDMGEIYLDLFLAVAGESGAAEIVDKALRLRRARKTQEALHVLLYLAKGGHLSADGRYQLALTRLLAEGRPTLTATVPIGGDATMGYFAALVREGFPVFDRLKKESMVAPEALLRIGRHFAHGVGNERRFGADVLEHLAEKHGKQRAGEEARVVLRTGGV